jgi:hypothetical protein
MGVDHLPRVIHASPSHCNSGPGDPWIDSWTALNIHPPPPKTSLIHIELSEAPCNPDLLMINNSLLWGIQYLSHGVFQQFLSTTQLLPPNI